MENGNINFGELFAKNKKIIIAIGVFLVLIFGYSLMSNGGELKEDSSESSKSFFGGRDWNKWASDNNCEATKWASKIGDPKWNTDQRTRNQYDAVTKWGRAVKNALSDYKIVKSDEFIKYAEKNTPGMGTSVEELCAVYKNFYDEIDLNNRMKSVSKEVQEAMVENVAKYEKEAKTGY